MARQTKDKLIGLVQAGLTKLHGKPATKADAARVLKLLTGKDPEYFRTVFKTTKDKLFRGTATGPLMQRVLGLVGDKGKARAAAKAGPKAEKQATKIAAASDATVKEETKLGLRYGKSTKYGVTKGEPAFGQLIENAASRPGARSTFGTAGKAAVGDTAEAVVAQEGKLDQLTRLRTKLLDPATDIRNQPGVLNVATGEARAQVNKATQITGSARQKAVTKALNTPSMKAAFADVRSQLESAGVKGKGLTKMMSNLSKSPSLLSLIGGGVGKGESALLPAARAAAPMRSLLGSKTGIGDLFGAGGFGQVGGADKIALAELTKGVGSKSVRLAGKVFRTGIPFAIFEAITVAPRLMREVGLDTEFNAQMGAIEAAGEDISHESLARKYKEDQLLASHKARMLEKDPMAMQFLMTTMDSGLPQKLTQNEVMIGGAPANPIAQDQAGDEIARAFMGM